MKFDLQHLRKEHNVTMDELSEILDISTSYYCQIENGVRVPSVRIAKRIGKELDFDWTLFYEDSRDAQ